MGWNLNEDILIASLHIQLDDTYTNDDTEFEKEKFINIVTQVRELLHSFDIHSATIQPEFFTQESKLSHPHQSNGKSSTRQNPPLNKNAFEETSELNCSVDNASGCFNQNCLGHS